MNADQEARPNGTREPVWTSDPLVEVPAVSEALRRIGRALRNEVAYKLKVHEGWAGRACYILGAEDTGLPNRVTARCPYVVSIPGAHSLNVAVAGSIVLYDRAAKMSAPHTGDRSAVVSRSEVLA